MVRTGRFMERLFLCLWLTAAAGSQTLPMTTVADTVYRADGTPAQGVLLISWPEFTTSGSQAVAAGTTTVTLGAGGALSVSLVPTADATPANTVYTVVYQLDDAVRTEYWTIPTTSPTNLDAVRTILGVPSSASQMATQQYVQTAVATRANDASVVHLSGSETITGAKQFAAAPSLPTPVGPNDAATKQYVDNSVQNNGSGSYVSKTGDTMTGPLTLSGNPSANNQAANKNYVDMELATKADLITGLVPTGELGSGSANNGVCLHGDLTWGACGSSSNAVSIQGVPVDTTAPADSQVITYVASEGKYVPKAGGGGSAGMQAIKYATDFAWTQSPSNDLSSPGVKTISLTACAPGVTGTEPYYYVYIAGTGTPEADLVTGGTCAGNGQPGSLQFTTVNAHPAGYTIGSASGGLQEALIAARIMPSNPNGPAQAGKVVVPPSEVSAYARISIRSSDITVDFSGSIVNCYMQDTCVYIGDSANSNAFLDITLLNPRGRPMVVSGQNPFIEVNAQKTRLVNVATRIPPAGGTFSSYVQVDGDQAFLLDGLDTSLANGSNNYGVLCNATVCNPVIYAPGGSGGNAAVGWLKNLNLAMQCAGNGVDWESGNTVRISDSVIEGYAQYGVRGGIKRGGYGGFELDNVYQEVGNCANPAGNLGQAGVIAQGATVKVQGGTGLAGAAPQFANTGSTDDRYFVVANHATYGPSNPLYAGNALTNGTGNITVTWPDIPGAVSFDLLRTTYNAAGAPREQAPYGSGNYAVATGLSRGSVCANGVCTATDTQAALQAYTVAIPAYFPLIDYWPGSLVLTASRDSNSVLDVATAQVQSVPSNVVAAQGMAGPAVVSEYCDPLYSWSPLWVSCYGSRAPGSFYDQGSFLLAVKPNSDSGQLTNLKGRLSFPTLGTAPGHIITLSDSNFQKTIATANNRPGNDPNDAFIGYDQGDGNPVHVGISIGAPVSISEYIGNAGDGTNWLERITAGLKEFKTSVQMDQGLSVATAVQANGYVVSGSGTWALQGGLGTSGAVNAGKSAIGFGSDGTLKVSENGGAVVGVAKLDSNGNVLENANTATQLAQRPAQCNGSFAIGVQANGNANCSTADVIQLSETSAPQGIPTYGIFWFDSSCHCPKVIDNNGQPVQLGLLNVFNADANTLEERNGTSPQALRIYQTTDAGEANYSRLSLGFDNSNNRYAISSDYLGNGSAYGIEFKVGATVPWYIGSSFHLLTGSDNQRDIGADALGNGNNGLGIRSLYYATALDGELTGGSANDWPNDPTAGTVLNKLAKITVAGGAVATSTSDTIGAIGVVIAGSGTTYNAEVVSAGFASCVYDGPTTTGDYVQISGTANGDCHDAGAVYPTNGQVLGRVMVTNAAAGTYRTYFFGAGVQGSSNVTNTVTSVFGRAGTVTAQSGDYSVSQVTGAAPAASPSFTGNLTFPITGSTQCLHVNSSGVLSGTGSDCGSGSGGMANPMTAQYDTIIGGSGGTPTRLATVNSSILITNSSGAETWASSIPQSQISGATQGEPVVGNPSGVQASSAAWLDATQFSGTANTHCTGSPAPLTNDMAGQIQAAICALPGSGGTVDARGFSTPLTVNSAFYASPVDSTGATLFGKQVNLLLPAGTITTNVTQFLPQQTFTKGLGSMTTVFRWGGGNQSSGNCTSGNHCTPVFCMGPPTNSGGVNYCDTSLYGSDGIAGHFFNSPRTQLESLKIDCSSDGSGTGNLNTVGVANISAQEKSWVKNAQIVNFTSYGIYVGPTGPYTGGSCGSNCAAANEVQNSGPYTDLEINYGKHTNAGGNTQDCTATTGIYVSNGPSVTVGAGGHITMNNNANNCDPTKLPLVAIGVSGLQPSVTGTIHCENWQTCISIGGAQNTTGATVTNVTTAASATTAVSISGSNSVSATITGVEAQGTNAIVDNQAGQTITDNVVALYVAAPSSATHAVVINAPATIPNLAGYASQAWVGLLYAPLISPILTGTPAAPTPSPGDNSTKIATTAYVQAQGYETTSAAQAAFAGTGSCTNQVVTGANANATPTCSSLATAQAGSNVQGNGTKFQLSSGTATSGDYTKFDANGNTSDSTVTAGPYSIPWLTAVHGSLTAGIFSSSSNKAAFVGVVLSFPLTTSKVNYYVATPDTSSATYDLGIYAGPSGGTCSLLAHTGSIAGSASMTSGWHTVSWYGGAAPTLQAGRYYIAYTSSAISGTAILEGDNSQVTWAGGETGVQLAT